MARPSFAPQLIKYFMLVTRLMHIIYILCAETPVVLVNVTREFFNIMGHFFAHEIPNDKRKN